MGTTIDECRTCKYAFTTGKDRWYCKKALADKDDCGEYEMAIKEVNEKSCDIPSLYMERLKADMVNILTEIQAEIEEIVKKEELIDKKWANGLHYSEKIIQQKINSLKAEIDPQESEE